MLFNSFNFLLFFPAVCLVYFLIPRKIRPCWLLAANIFFYLCWNWKFPLMLIITILTTWAGGWLIQGSASAGGKKNSQKWLVFACFLINIGILFFYKYLDFAFVQLNKLMSLAHLTPIANPLSFVVPLGISFYTFKALSYIMDIYRGKIEAERNPLIYAAYISFFPTLIAGPIDRAQNTIRQIRAPKSFDFNRVKYGLWLMLWGYFQKIVIADRLALFVNTVFDDQAVYVHSGVVGILASVFYTFQIYCDFAGYSNLAIGAAQILGFEIPVNFVRPYFAKSMIDFWKRWHISLTGWFRDYVYIPLGGNRVSKPRHLANILIVFLVSGLWHGAGLNFIFWGFLHGLSQVFEIMLRPLYEKTFMKMKTYGSFGYRLAQTILTFSLVSFNWIFFRAENLNRAFAFIKGLFSYNPYILFTDDLFLYGLNRVNFEIAILSLLVLLVVSWQQRTGSLREKIDRQPLWLRWTLIFGCLFAVLLYGIYGPGFDAADFIYAGF